MWSIGQCHNVLHHLTHTTQQAQLPIGEAAKPNAVQYTPHPKIACLCLPAFTTIIAPPAANMTGLWVHTYTHTHAHAHASEAGSPTTGGVQSTSSLRSRLGGLSWCEPRQSHMEAKRSDTCVHVQQGASSQVSSSRRPACSSATPGTITSSDTHKTHAHSVGQISNAFRAFRELPCTNAF